MWAVSVLQIVCKCVLPQAEAHRRRLEAMKRHRDEVERNAGIQIQTMWRGFLERRKIFWLHGRLQRAIRTQMAHYRHADVQAADAEDEGTEHDDTAGMSRAWAEVWTEPIQTESLASRAHRHAAAAARARAQSAAHHAQVW